jgi:hypothetical protein
LRASSHMDHMRARVTLTRAPPIVVVCSGAGGTRTSCTPSLRPKVKQTMWHIPILSVYDTDLPAGRQANLQSIADSERAWWHWPSSDSVTWIVRFSLGGQSTMIYKTSRSYTSTREKKCCNCCTYRKPSQQLQQLAWLDVLLRSAAARSSISRTWLPSRLCLSTDHC